MNKLSDLKKRIVAARGNDGQKKIANDSHSYANLGMQILTELMAAFLAGGILGYWLDSLFGTRPVLFVIFIFIGIITGLVNSYRVAYGLKPLADPGLLQKKKNTGKDDSTE